MATQYYFISDLHIGGDGALDNCDFEPELIDFLRMLEEEGNDAELVIAGDFLGLWEFTTLAGPDKLHAIVASHVDLFRQFQRTGSRIRITVIPGNHDHDLVTAPEYAAILRIYNIHLEPAEAITRPLAGRILWIEHGHQHDAYNRYEVFGDPAAKPLGYYVTTNIISGAGQRTRNSQKKWLQNIESVYPTEYVPHWLFSNYFYREMSTYVRTLFIPSMLVFIAGALMVMGALLEVCGLVASGRFLSSFSHSLGQVGYVLDGVFVVGGAAFIAILLLLIPLIFLRHDMRKALLRYNLGLSQTLQDKKNEEYAFAAQEVFRKHPKVAVFIFGHSHIADITVHEGRAIVNTGAWVKHLTRIPSRVLLLPDVYAPSYRLGYFRVIEEHGHITVYYHSIPKETTESLSLLQRIAIFGHPSREASQLPERTVLNKHDAPARTAETETPLPRQDV